jgi:hypothetical protein
VVKKKSQCCCCKERKRHNRGSKGFSRDVIRGVYEYNFVGIVMYAGMTCTRKSMSTKSRTVLQSQVNESRTVCDNS